MKVFIGEPGFEYKENFKSFSNAALSGGVTSVVSMPNTSPAIDNVSMVDFILRRGRDKSVINIFPAATLTRNMEGKLMTEFGLLSKKGIIGFTDATKTIQNSEIMSRIMNYASEHNIYPRPYKFTMAETDTVSINQSMTFEVLSETLGVDIDIIKELNPIYKRNLIPVSKMGTASIRLPYKAVATFVNNSDSIYAYSESLQEKYGA